MANIYLDYAATSRKHFDIIEKNLNILKEIYANPSGGHTLGKRMKSFLEKHVKKLPNQSVQNLKKLYLLLVEQKVIIQFSTMY